MDGLLAGKFVITAGFGVWSMLNVYNHFADFNGALQGVADVMKMTSFDDPPPVPSPLKRRAIDNPALHRLALVAITVVHGINAVLFSVAAVLLLFGSVDAGSTWALWGFAVSGALWFGFLIAGNWFGYWLRLDALQRTHLALLATAMLGMILMSV
ncbi:MAG: DUF2165 family protein [Bauldia sp.]|nr:DUF2165 family protein [Bauldia sp.]